MAAARELKVKVQLGVKVVDLDVAETTITLESGEHIYADQIIAADGIYVRRASLLDSLYLTIRNHSYRSPALHHRHKTAFSTCLI